MTLFKQILGLALFVLVVNYFYPAQKKPDLVRERMIYDQSLSEVFDGEHSYINYKYGKFSSLEIYNDDTECSHSATSGSLDKEKLFYLKTRGINENDAKDFLIKSFIDELASQIKSRRLRDYVNEIIAGNYKV